MSQPGNKAIATSKSPIQFTGWHESKKLYLKAKKITFLPQILNNPNDVITK